MEENGILMLSLLVKVRSISNVQHTIFRHDECDRAGKWPHPHRHCGNCYLVAVVRVKVRVDQPMIAGGVLCINGRFHLVDFDDVGDNLSILLFWKGGLPRYIHSC